MNRDGDDVLVRLMRSRRGTHEHHACNDEKGYPEHDQLHRSVIATLRARPRAAGAAPARQPVSCWCFCAAAVARGAVTAAAPAAGIARRIILERVRPRGER